MKTCKGPDCNYSVFGGGYCMIHQFLREDKKRKPLKRTPLKRTAIKRKAKPKSKVLEEKKEQEAMWDVFLALWDQLEDIEGIVYCYESQFPLPRGLYRNSTLCYHHVLPKNKNAYPQYKLTAKNIVIIHPNVHILTESDIDKTPRIKAYKKELLKLHDKGLL